MKRKLKIWVAFFVTISVSGCASGKLRSDYDKSVDFSQYRTYNFYEGAGPESDRYQSLFSQYMVRAIDMEMQKRGYEKTDDDPDLLVNFNANLQEKTKVTTTPAPMPAYGMRGYYAYRRGFYDPWSTYGYASETHVSQYTEGTFNIDLVDPRTRRLVWEAVGVGRVSQASLENLEERVMAGVPRFFELYPFEAGSGVPVQEQ